MRFLREIMRSVSVHFPLFRWRSGYLRRPAYLESAAPDAHDGSHGPLFFCVSLLLHAAAIFALAATPGPKRASAIEVTLFTPSPSFEAGQGEAVGGQEKTAQRPERKSPHPAAGARPERTAAPAAAAASAAASMAQSLAQASPREIPTAAATGGGGQSATAASSGEALSAGGRQAGEAGTAQPGTNDSTLAQYLGLVRERIGRYKKYPLLARKRELEGQVGIRFLLTGAGEAQRLAVSKSSGQEILDKAALRAVQDGAPFPPPPANLLAEPLTIELNIVFNLQ